MNRGSEFSGFSLPVAAHENMFHVILKAPALPTNHPVLEWEAESVEIVTSDGCGNPSNPSDASQYNLKN